MGSIRRRFSIWFKATQKYVIRTHNAQVPTNYIDDDNFNLGTWVHHRRDNYKNNLVEPIRIRQLELLEGWSWDPFEEDFQFGLKQLRKYVNRTRNARVPARYIDDDNFKLGGWVSYRRAAYKKKTLNLNHIRQLESVKGWVWDPLEEDFYLGLKQLKKYVKDKHNARVHQRYTDEDNFNLGTWVSNLRNSYKRCKIDSEYISKLESIDSWYWDPIEEDFQFGLNQLKKYVRDKHNTRVHQRYTDEDNFNLGTWVSSRRIAYKRDKIDPEHIRQLESIDGWLWDASKKL